MGSANQEWPVGMQVGISVGSFVLFVGVCAVSYYVDDPDLRKKKKIARERGEDFVTYSEINPDLKPGVVGVPMDALLEAQGNLDHQATITSLKGQAELRIFLPSYTKSLGEAERLRLKQQMLQERRRTMSESGAVVNSAPSSPRQSTTHLSETTAHLDFVLNRVGPVFSRPGRHFVLQPRKRNASGTSTENVQASGAGGGGGGGAGGTTAGANVDATAGGTTKFRHFIQDSSANASANATITSLGNKNLPMV